MEYEKDWQEKYSDMIATPAQALSHLKSGQRVFIGTGCGAPQELIGAMTQRARSVTNVEIIQLITKGEAPYADKKMSESFAINAFFISSNIRDVIQEGFGDYTPILLSDVPKLLDSGILPIDIALIQVTPPDTRGRVSLGISVDIVRSATENASLVIAEVNPNMPWTHGDTQVDVYDLDILVPVDRPILERQIDPPNEISRKIAKAAAALIPNGATIELGLGRVPGYGRIPQVVMEFLHDRKDIGFHTEMISDTIIPLIESGAVTGAMKTIDRGKITASFCMGTKKLYDYIHDNPMFSFRPTEYLNDANVIGKHKRMVAVNMALEIDLTGQVCSDSLGGALLFGHRRPDRFQPRRRQIRERPCDHHPAVPEQGGGPVADRLHPATGVRSGHQPGERPLCSDRIRGRLPPRQIYPGAGHGPDLDRPPGFPGTAVPGGGGREISAARSRPLWQP